jgi:Fur family transcriptional regulator, ferric uptake regulator
MGIVDDDHDDLHAIVTRRLRADGQRYTRQRRSLIEVLDASEAPLTLPQLLQQAEGLAQSSAYRNLAVLERAHVVHRIITTGDHACWELAEDLTEHHHHLICTTCGEVNDFTIPADVEEQMEKALDRVATDAGFTATHHRLDLIGECSRCHR